MRGMRRVTVVAGLTLLIALTGCDLGTTLIEMDETVIPEYGESSSDAVAESTADTVLSASDMPESGTATSAPDFTIVILPDTQGYVAWKNSIMVSQIDWLLTNAVGENLRFVAHVGDLVQNYDSVITQWAFVSAQMARLSDAGIPFSANPGNHDYRKNTRESSMYNAYFPLDMFREFGTFGGSFEAASDNTWHLVDTGAEPLLVMALEFGPREAVVAWANEVLAGHSDTRAMIVTHAYLSPQSTRLSSGDGHAASNGYGLGDDVNDGDELWEKLVYPNNNVAYVICGHDGLVDDGSGLLVSHHEDGSPVYQILSNYQYYPWSDTGYILLLRFSPAAGTVDMRTYSPYLDRYRTDVESQAVFPL